MMRGKYKKQIKRAAAISLIMAALSSGQAMAANPNWYQDASGWHYYKSNTQLAKDEALVIDGVKYFFDTQGVMQTGWVNRNHVYYFCNDDGSTATGWKEVNGQWYYLQADGSCLMNGVTPDCYVVDATGAYQPAYRVIAGVKVQKPDLFVAQDSSAMNNWAAMLGALGSIGQLAYAQTDGARAFHIYQDKISWCELSGSSEKELLSLEKVAGTKGYRIRISTVLNNNSTDLTKGETYDFQVLRLFCYGFSNSAATLDNAIYDSFVGSNRHGIGNSSWITVGDCKVIFTPESGSGCYEIQPAQD